MRTGKIIIASDCRQRHEFDTTETSDSFDTCVQIAASEIGSTRRLDVAPERKTDRAAVGQALVGAAFSRRHFSIALASTARGVRMCLGARSRLLKYK